MSWLKQPWVIVLACVLVVIASSTFDVIWITHHPQVVVVRVDIPGFGGVK